jgi:DNA-binding IscR family transcriptional regulator
MIQDGRLSSVLHLLLHLSTAKAPLTSAQLAMAMGSNAVVARRVLAGLRDAGIVGSSKGHGGGWILRMEPEQVTLRAVYAALGEPRLFAFGNRNDTPSCLLERAVNAALGQTIAKAEALLLTEMESVTLASLAQDFDARLEASGITGSEINNA